MEYLLKKSIYSSVMLLGIISKLYKIQGTKIINAITIGNKIVQLNNINWSNLIRGNEALTQIKVKIKKHVFNPKLKPPKSPSTKG